MKQQVQELVQVALAHLAASGVLPDQESSTPHLERTRDPSHGDFSTNAAMTMAKAARTKPRDLAQRLVDTLPPSTLIDRVEIAGPGFVNFFLSSAAYRSLVPTILDVSKIERV